MGTWEFYLDESYNSHLFCVGGFFAPAGMWKEISAGWRARIAYENRKSEVRRFPPISRYHATDCANLKGEFDKKNGWNIPRQIRLTKSLCRIIGKAGPCGIAVGGRIADVRQHFEPTGNNLRESLYDLCFRMSLTEVGKAVREHFPGTATKVICDDSKNFGNIARSSFESLRSETSATHLSRHFLDPEPANSRDCIPLQCADFLAYEAMRRLDGIRRGSENIRKSLQALIGTNIPLHISQFTDENFRDLHRMIENKRTGRPTGEGVESGLLVSVSS